jgi:translation elongation factor EF-Tu-like GTPase
MVSNHFIYAIWPINWDWATKLRLGSKKECNLILRCHVNIQTIEHVDHGKTTLTTTIIMALDVMHGDIAKKYNEIDTFLKEKTRGIMINIVHHFNP